MLRATLLAAALIAAGSTMAAAQGGGAGGEPARLGDANPPGALRQGGVPPAAVLRRDDAMAPLAQPQFNSRQVSAPRGFANNPTPTWNDPPGTRTQCRGGCR